MIKFDAKIVDIFVIFRRLNYFYDFEKTRKAKYQCQ